MEIKKISENLSYDVNFLNLSRHARPVAKREFPEFSVSEENWLMLLSFSLLDDVSEVQWQRAFVQGLWVEDGSKHRIKIDFSCDKIRFQSKWTRIIGLDLFFFELNDSFPCKATHLLQEETKNQFQQLRSKK